MIKEIFNKKRYRTVILNNLKSLAFSQINKSSFFRFLLVGASATLLHYLLMGFMIYIHDISATNSSAIGYIISAFYNYWANSQFSFTKVHSLGRRLPRFILVTVTGLLINHAILLVGIYFFVPIVISQLAATFFVLIWNYILNAVWTFSLKDI